MKDQGTRAFYTRHRLHSVGQILQFVEHITGAKRHYRPTNIHLMSDYAIMQLAAGKNAMQSLRRAADDLERSETVVIEISQLAEFLVGDFCVGNFTARDCRIHARALNATGLTQPVVERKPQTLGECVRGMAKIRTRLLDKRLIWVCHMVPPPDLKEHERVIKVRKSLASAVKAGAKGDMFIDPSETAVAVGPHKFFRDPVADLNHLAEEGVKAMANRYSAAAQGDVPGRCA